MARMVSAAKRPGPPCATGTTPRSLNMDVIELQWDTGHFTVGEEIGAGIEVRIPKRLAKLVGLTAGTNADDDNSSLSESQKEANSDVVNLIESQTIKLALDPTDIASKVSLNVNKNAHVPDYVYVQCDMIEPVIFGNTRRQILGIVPIRHSSTLNPAGGRKNRTFTLQRVPHLIPRRHNDIINFKLLTKEGEIVKFKDEDEHNRGVTYECLFELQK